MSDRCKACGQPWDNHLGIEGTCRELREARAELAEKAKQSRTVFCCWCGAVLHRYTRKDDADFDLSIEAMQAHDEICPDNPLRKKLEQAEAERDKALENLRVCGKAYRRLDAEYARVLGLMEHYGDKLSEQDRAALVQGNTEQGGE